MLTDMLGGLRERFGTRRVIVDVPAGYAANVPTEAEEETSPESVSNAQPLSMPMAVFIEYVDSKGVVSSRSISCKGYDVSRDTIKAFCHTRRAVRSFKVSRIREVIDAQTGEVLGLQEVVLMLRGGAIPVHDERLARILTILVFLMRCDGEAHPAERDVIEAAASGFALRFGGDDATVSRALSAAFRTAPDVDDLILALQWIARQPDCLALVRLIMPLIDRIVMADGVVASQEAYFGGIVLDALKQMGPKQA